MCVKDRLGLETSDNFFSVDLYPVPLNNVFHVLFRSLLNFTSYKCLLLLSSEQREAGNVADLQRKMLSTRI